MGVVGQEKVLRLAQIFIANVCVAILRKGSDVYASNSSFQFPSGPPKVVQKLNHDSL